LLAKIINYRDIFTIVIFFEQNIVTVIALLSPRPNYKPCFHSDIMAPKGVWLMKVCPPSITVNIQRKCSITSIKMACQRTCCSVL